MPYSGNREMEVQHQLTKTLLMYHLINTIKCLHAQQVCFDTQSTFLQKDKNIP